jgi:hypothetical protein
MRRYLDDELVLGIDGDSIQSLTGAMIPEVRPTGAFTHLGTPYHNKHLHSTHTLSQEPMYLILNTAISHRWGMPEPCPADTCSACWHCYDCTNPGEASAPAILQPIVAAMCVMISPVTNCRVPVCPARRAQRVSRSPRRDARRLHQTVPGPRRRYAHAELLPALAPHRRVYRPARR